jgi:hypothetical protein
MKTRSFFLLLTIVLFQCCAPSTYITGSWKSPATGQKTYKSILVAALTSNTIVKDKLENDIATSLSRSANVMKSINEFPPSISNSDTNKVKIMEAVQKKNVDAILTISLLSKETESRYIPDRNPYSPLGYNYYQSFWGYYSYWYPQFYGQQGYYNQDKVYYIETNLYDTSTEKLIWSAQSKTYSPDNLEAFSKEFAEVIVTKMKTDGVLSAN